MAWCCGYFFICMIYPLPHTEEEALDTWNTFSKSVYGALSFFLFVSLILTGSTVGPVLLHLVIIVVVTSIIWKGIISIEKALSKMVVVLVVALFLAMIRAVTLTNAGRGASFLFTVDPATLPQANLYIQALAQISYDTAAGWGIFLIYAHSMQDDHSVVHLSVLTPLLNNIMSFICCLTTFCTCFATLADAHTDKEILEIMKDSGPSGTGLTFIFMPVLFNKIEFGRVWAVFYFGGLSLAGIGSMVAQLHMQTSTWCPLLLMLLSLLLLSSLLLMRTATE